MVYEPYKIKYFGNKLNYGIMKKLLVLLVTCLCLIACEERKPVHKIITGTIVSYEHHDILPDESLVKCDNGTFYTLSETCGLDGIFIKYLYDNKIHIKLTINIDENGYQEVTKVERFD